MKSISRTFAPSRRPTSSYENIFFFSCSPIRIIRLDAILRWRFFFHLAVQFSGFLKFSVSFVIRKRFFTFEYEFRLFNRAQRRQSLPKFLLVRQPVVLRKMQRHVIKCARISGVDGNIIILTWSSVVLWSRTKKSALTIQQFHVKTTEQICRPIKRLYTQEYFQSMILGCISLLCLSLGCSSCWN